MKSLIKLALLVCTGAFFSAAKAQILTKEDSLQAGLNVVGKATVLSGYGEGKVSYDTRYGTGTANITRMVTFFGHRFSNRVLFFSELELENAAVGPSFKGEISLEQMVLKMNLNRDVYLMCGLFIPRIGITNENHLPTTFNGNDRPYLETLILPATWREIGVGLYGRSRRLAGLNYSLGVVNGLNASNFKFGSGISEGRMQGSMANASNLAVTGSLLHYYRNFRFQISAYAGGTNGLPKWESDSLALQSGLFANPVITGEANIQYLGRLLHAKAMACVVSIPNAYNINRAYANNTPEQMVGAYLELGYDLLRLKNPESNRSLVVFSRVESLNLNKALPKNGVNDDFQKQLFWVTGLTYKPLPGIAFKFDWVRRTTGDYNPALYIVNPYDPKRPFYNTKNTVNLGFAFSF